MNYIPGIDVSHWQGTISWNAVKAAGVQFAFIKATEGTSYVDTSFTDNWAGARQAGILRGAYHFFRPLQDARKQADLFLKTIELLDDDLPPVIDLEVSDNLKSATLIQRVEIWIQEVENRTGRKPIIYTGVAFLNDNFTIAAGGPPLWAKSHPLWIANYLGPAATQPILPRGWNKWSFWQHTATGKVSGIAGDVDLDWFNGPVEELFALANKLVTPTTARTYSAKAGDTLFSIADAFQIELVDLIKANPQLLPPGTVLTIPSSEEGGGETPNSGGSSGGGVSPTANVYIIQPGDTLTAIAARFHTTVDALIKANQIANPNVIEVGARLIIP